MCLTKDEDLHKYTIILASNSAQNIFYALCENTDRLESPRIEVIEVISINCLFLLLCFESQKHGAYGSWSDRQSDVKQM